ncbi:hypothetical protein AN477_12445 [Alicyclobacillus ferrooxydans]|uniref:Uncharacterized protein n=1 Tax=Alicyclobacillus ferrooxydans TaxID=471514 RepID=A0A0P9EK27_9BACL|nr:hypothetical protein AN477_12445 [Alicyclobacillus ferrooxydans]
MAGWASNLALEGPTNRVRTFQFGFERSNKDANEQIFLCSSDFMFPAEVKAQNFPCGLSLPWFQGSGP